MDAKDFVHGTRTEDACESDVEQFIAILERVNALKKALREGVLGERMKEGEKKIVGVSKCDWMSFEWEDFCEQKSGCVNGDGGVKIRGGSRGVTQEVQGSIRRLNKRLRDPVESAANSSAERRPGRRFSSPEVKAESSTDVRVLSFDLNSYDEE